MRKLLILPIAAALAAGCTDDEGGDLEGAARDLMPGERQVSLEEVRREGREAWESLKGYGYQKKDEYHEAASRTLEKLSRDIEELEARAERATAETRRELDDEIAALERRKEAAREKLGELEMTGKEAWDGFVRGFNVSVEELREAYERTAARLREE